jgi:hypothetical protein
MQVLLEHRPAGLKIRFVRVDVPNANDVIEATASFDEHRFDVPETLLCLLYYITRNHHGLIVVASGARYKNVIAIHHGSGIADPVLKFRPTGDFLVCHC